MISGNSRKISRTIMSGASCRLMPAVLSAVAWGWAGLVWSFQILDAKTARSVNRPYHFMSSRNLSDRMANVSLFVVQRRNASLGLK